MKVIEFYLKEGLPEERFEVLCNRFYNLGDKHKRRVDNVIGSPIFAISFNQNTRWVQLLIDEDTPTTILNIIENVVRTLSDNGKYVLYDSDEGKEVGKRVIAPRERKKEEIGI